MSEVTSAFWSAIAAGLSAVAALASIGIAVWQTRVTRHHNKNTVRPILVFHTDRTFSGGGVTLTVTIHNKGVGPALIRKTAVFLAGVPFDTSESVHDIVPRLAERLFSAYTPYALKRWCFPNQHIVLTANEVLVLAEIHLVSMSEADYAKWESDQNPMVMLITYESIYGDEFVTSSQNAQH